MSSDPLFFFFVSVIMAMSVFLFSSSVCNSSVFSAIPLTFHVATFSFPNLCPPNLAVSAFVDVGVGFADRAAAVVAVGFLRIYGFYISASV
jgi:hypothetical protein